MSQKGGVLQKLKQALKGFGIKAPWAYTGPVSTPEYLQHLPRATEYRRVAPQSQPIRAMVPQAELDRVYDIKYYVRDTRKAYLPGGTMKMVRGEYDVKAKDEVLEAMEVSPTQGKTHRWGKWRHILDHDNNGYTV